MAGSSLFALIDDIATILDDVALMSKVAAKKTAGVLGDDLALYELYNKGYIAYEEALRNADSANGLRLQIKLHGGRAEPGEGGGAFGALSIEQDAAPDDESKT